MKQFCLVAIMSVAFLHAGQSIPVRFEDHLIFVKAQTRDGQALEFFTDTGGGFFVLDTAIERLGLHVEESNGNKTALIPIAQPGKKGWIPWVSPQFDRTGGRIFVMPDGPRSAGMGDGMLGQQWFGGKVWTFDYKNKALVLHQATSVQSWPEAHTVSLGFKSGEDGQRLINFPSIRAWIDGESHFFLFDTGAQVALTDEARVQLGGSARRATSFITQTLFDTWRKKHPDWRVVEQADANVGRQPMIRVPRMEIAGYEVGPVWFTRRPDNAFHEYMSSMMDRKVEGALGGSLFQYFVITVDYPGSRASFELIERP